MNIEKAMKYNDPYDTPPLVIDIPAGEQVLDGEHAIQYLRYRKGYSEGDIGRIAAQQEFVESAFKQALGMKLPTIAKTVFNNVESDITVGATSSLALNAIGMTSDQFETYTAPGVPDTKYGLSFWVLDDQAVQEMLLQIYNITETTTEGSVTT